MRLEHNYYVILASLEGESIYQVKQWNNEVKELILWANDRWGLVAVIKGFYVEGRLDNKHLQQLYDEIEVDIQSKKYYKNEDITEDLKKLDRLKTVFC